MANKIYTIQELVAERTVPLDSRPAAALGDHDWLVRALKKSVGLEFSTIPVYLFILWSIKDEQNFASRSIREILQEEMVHMGLACNMLLAIGETPDFTDRDITPTYPSKLKDDIKPGLELRLVGLNRSVLRTLIDLEAPPEQDDYAPGAVSDFYEKIREVFHSRPAKFDTSRQIAGPLSPMTIGSLDDVDAAIDIIIAQGEGGGGTPFEKNGDLGHYWRLREIYEGRRLVEVPDNPDDKYQFIGDLIEWPKAFVVGEVPKGGYVEDQVPPAVWDLLVRFDRTYAGVLKMLGRAWCTGDQGVFLSAVRMMFSMREIARELMQTPIGNHVACYGPSFRPPAS